jgi:hypothetical protein
MSSMHSHATCESRGSLGLAPLPRQTVTEDDLYKMRFSVEHEVPVSFAMSSTLTVQDNSIRHEQEGQIMEVRVL